MTFTFCNLLSGPWFSLNGEPYDPINVDTLPVVVWCGDHDKITVPASPTSGPEASATMPHDGPAKPKLTWSFNIDILAITQSPASGRKITVKDKATLYLRYYQPSLDLDQVNYGLFTSASSQWPYSDKNTDLGLATQRY